MPYPCPHCGKSAKVKRTFLGPRQIIRKYYCLDCGFFGTSEAPVSNAAVDFMIQQEEAFRKTGSVLALPEQKGE